MYMWKVARTKVDLLKLRVVVCHIVQVFSTRVEERRSQPVDSHPLAFSTLFSDNLKILRLSPEIIALSQFYAEGLQATIKSNFLPRIVKYYSRTCWAREKVQISTWVIKPYNTVTVTELKHHVSAA